MKRAHWGSRIGFILATAGSAVGLGNVWKFPYMAAQNGGAAFLLVYVAIVFTIGISVMLAEFAIGRAGERNPVGALRRLKGGPWPVVGYMGIAAAFIILSFYSVVAGWTIAYAFKAAAGVLATSDPEVLGAMFNDFSGNPAQPILYHLLFMALTVGVVAVVFMVGSSEVARSCSLFSSSFSWFWRSAHSPCRGRWRACASICSLTFPKSRRRPSMGRSLKRFSPCRSAWA
jgi:SNF family Na+-dependent transporter